MKSQDTQRGFAFALSAYLIWGFLPFFMKALGHIPPPEVIAHRVVWSVPIAALVLVVRGETSNILAPDAAERLRDALPKGELVTVEKAGHGVPSQNTKGFLAALVPWLGRVAG